MIQSDDINRAWQTLLGLLLDRGDERKPRDLLTKEILNVQIAIPMVRPLLTVKSRKLGYRFAAAEAAWILDGDNRLATIHPYAKAMDLFSDDGQVLAGAYGPPLRDQLSYAAQALAKDPATRQAVITLWRPRPGPSKDIPCTISLQWLIRDKALHCTATMRSSDAWLGLPYDMFVFSCISGYLLSWLLDPQEEFNDEVHHLGTLCLNLASSHLYERHWAQASAVSRDPERVFGPYPKLSPSTWTGQPERFRRHLQYLADGAWGAVRDSDWLVPEYKSLQQSRHRAALESRQPMMGEQ